MEIRNVTAEQLEFAAHKAKVRMMMGGGWGAPRYGVPVEPVGTTKQGGRVWRLTLRTVMDDAGRVIWGRVGFVRSRTTGKRRRVPGAVCWHGHREFMRALLTLAPHATIISAFARYNGLEHFEATHAATGERNIGSQMDPLTLADACDCESDE